MNPIQLAPGVVPLAAWRDVYRGASVALGPASYGVIDRSARAVSAILAKGEPVYGINTGFGKLASVRIDTADLEKLQRNIVLSHAAGVGPPMPVAKTIGKIAMMATPSVRSLGRRRWTAPSMTACRSSSSDWIFSSPPRFSIASLR